MIGMNNVCYTPADRNVRLTVAVLHDTLPHLRLADLHGYLLALQDVGDVVLYRQAPPRALARLAAKLHRECYHPPADALQFVRCM